MDFPFLLGNEGRAVADVQRKLASLDGSDIAAIAALQQTPLDRSVSGVYDETTAGAMRAFKQRYGLLPDDGSCTKEAWTELNLQTGSVFNEVWQYELDALRGGDASAGVTPARDTLVSEAHARQLTGLAFSGGGIRSATFNLGILQALAEMRLLRNFDYLSTVSGGGYIGAWFSRWLAREHGNIATLEQALTPGARNAPQHEPDEVKFLRQYTNYLTPRTGFFSADTWALVATYVRNTTLNMAILVALLAAVMVVPRLFATLIAGTPGQPGAYWPVALPPGFATLTAVAIGSVLWSVLMIAFNIAARPDRRSTGMLGQSQASVIAWIVLPLMLAGLSGSVVLWHFRDVIATAVTDKEPALWWWIFGTGGAYFVAWCIGWGCAQWRNARLDNEEDEPDTRPWRMRAARVLGDGLGHLFCALTALAVGTLAVLGITSALARVVKTSSLDAQYSMTVAVVAFGMPVLLTVFGFTMVLCVGLVGRRYTDKSREWWSRQSGWTTIVVGAWVALVAVSLYAPGVLAWVHGHIGTWASALLAGGWLGTTAAGLFVGKSNTSALPGGRSRLELLARVAPLVFSVGLMCVQSALVHRLLAGSGPSITIDDKTRLGRVLLAFDAQTLAMTPFMLVIVLGALVFVGLVLAWRIDINKFSLHMMYRNRLVRAYLGASNRKRAPHPFTGFDPKDDIQMAVLRQQDATGDRLQRPYHIINTTLNLVKGEELAWQARKAAGFAFTPAFCGFELPRPAAPGGACRSHEAMRGGFRPATFYTPRGKELTEEDGGVRLGMAMATSGAAASPSMGFHSSPPLAFLMTLFNVRLGRWFVNPGKLIKGTPHVADVTVPANAPQTVAARPTSPRIGIFYLLAELFGLTNARSNFLYLSDGGHFENLGVYELVRRRCRLIVLVDAGADGQFDFSDLGNAIRKCGTDLNVEVEIDVGKIDLVQQNAFSQAHCTVGRIRYDKIDEGGEMGTLLYIKPSLLGNEHADILNYRKINKGFPHQSTLDQWFDEDQFETYRTLGYKIGKIVLAKAVAASAPRATAPGQENMAELLDIPSLCTRLEAQWGGALQNDDDAAVAQRLYLVTDRRNGERRKMPAAAIVPPHKPRKGDRRIGMQA